MGFCSKCGTGLVPGAAYCGSCGNPAAGGPPPPAQTSRDGTGLDSNVAGLLAYLLGFITGIIFLVIEPYKNDPFVRFHAFQSIFFSVAWFVFWMLWTSFFMIGVFSSFGFLWTIMSLVSTLVSLGVFLLWLFLMYKAYNRERFMLPFIGELASKQAG